MSLLSGLQWLPAVSIMVGAHSHTKPWASFLCGFCFSGELTNTALGWAFVSLFPCPHLMSTLQQEKSSQIENVLLLQ